MKIPIIIACLVVMFDLFVEDVKIGTQELNSNDPGKFFDVNYVLSPGLIKNQNHP